MQKVTFQGVIREGVLEIPFAYRDSLEGKTVHAVLVEGSNKSPDTGIPHPLDPYYSWPIKNGWIPMQHQKETTKFLIDHDRAYCLNDMGTAKTLSALWAFDYLRQEGRLENMLVICPLSTVERTWGDEIFSNLPHLRYVVLHGSRNQRIQLLNKKVDIYIINHDGVKVILDDLVAKGFHAVLIDELSQAARNASTDRWKSYKKLIQNVRVVWGMTGTPIPNAPTDAWAQCRLITPSTVPQYFGHFRDLTMRQTTESRWVPREGALDLVHKGMQPAIRYKRDECIDLPPVMYETRQTDLTPEQRQMFKEMMIMLYTEFKGQTITAINETVKTMKLIQICVGAAYGDEDAIIINEPKNRLLVLKEVIEESSSKVIVFVPFKSALKMVAEHLSKNFTVEVIHGGVGKFERDRIFNSFQSEENPRVLVAQPATMSHGLSLTSASAVVWFAPIMSAETYEQANARITRPGQKYSQLIIHLQGTDLEAEIYQRLKMKVNLQGVLLDMFNKKMPA